MDKRDDGEASELGTYPTIAEAKVAIENYRKQGSMIACNGPADSIESWIIEDIRTDDILAFGN